MLKKGTERGQVTDKLRTVYRKAVESGKAAAGFLLEICTSTNGYASRGRVGQSGVWEQYLFSEAVTALLKMLQTDTGRRVFDHVFPHTDTADTPSERLLSIADSALTDPRARSRRAKP